MAFRAVARECGYDFRLLDEVMRINEDQRAALPAESAQCAVDACAARISASLASPSRAAPTTSANRPRFSWCRPLLQEGSKITAYDPAAMERTQEVMNSGVTFANSAYEAAHGADALLILTEWEEFANLDLDRLRHELKYPNRDRRPQPV